MKEFKGTKGEWKVAERVTDGTKGYEIHWSEDGECVTDHVYDLHDAKLIAAAPELLEALLSMRVILNSYKRLDKSTLGYKAQEKAFKAINKAL